MLALQWQLERSQWWPRATLVEHQFRQVRALLGHAIANVPYYGDALARAGLRNIEDLDAKSFLRWPILRKSMVRGNEALLRAKPYPPEHGQSSWTYTTGSTGEPLRVAHTGLTRFFFDALAIRDHLLHERRFAEKYAVFKPSLPAARYPGWGAINALFETGPLVTQDSGLDVAVQLDWLVAEKPGYVQGRAANLLALLRHSRASGKVPQGIRQLLVYGDMRPPDLAALAREVWNAGVAATYSCMELGALASQ